MELPQLVVELVGDYSKLMEDIKKARVEAIKQAQFLEKDLNLTIGVNDDSLKNLNKHFDLKVTHFKQTQTYFKNNPLKVFVDDGELTNLNKELDKLGQRKVTANVSVNNNGSGNKNNTVGDVVKGVIMSPVNMAANIAMSPFRAVGKVADAIGKGIDNIAVGFTEEIGRSMSIKLTGKSTKQFAKKIQDGFRLVDEEIIGKSQVYETFFAELISSGSFDKAKFAAGKRTKMQKQLNRLGDLQVIANLEEEYKSNKNTPSSIEAVDRILSEEPELKKKFEAISSKKSSLSLDEHKRRFIPTIIKEAQPTDLSNKVILPLMKEVQPILNFIQGMQSYHTSKLSESHYQARKATFPILEPGQKVVSVIGGAEDKFGQGGRALATSLEPIVGKNIKLLPVENLDTDVSKRTAEIDKWTDDVLIKKLLPGMGSLSPTIKNAVRQIAYSLNPLGSDVAAAQALAHTRLAREQGNDASAISFSLGGASAYRYAKAAEYEGTKTKALAMAYPFSNLSNATPKGFASAILEKDPLTFPFKIGVYNPSSAMNILDDSGLRSSGANVHATHHLFRSPGFVEKFNDTVGSSLPTDKTSRDTMSDLQRLMLQVHQVVISTMHAKDLASKGQYSQGVIKNLFDSKYLFGQLSNERMPEQVRSMATILRGQAVDAGTLMLSNAEKTERPTGQLKDLPNDESHPGYQRYKQVASVINQSIESFKTRTVVPGAYFAGGLKREDVAARNQELSQKTIPWFKSQKQFEEYGREIIKGLEIVAKLQEEFVRTHGNISPKFLDKIDYLPTENLKTDVMEKIKFPDNVTDPGFMRYVDEVSGINESIQTFKENKAIPDKGWWAGGLNVGKVAERKRDLSIATIPWFESQKQFEEYGKKIVQGFKVILSLQEEFIKTKGNISPDFLDKIEYLPTIPGSEKIPKYASEQSPEFRNLSEYFEENLNLKKLPISDAMREHPASILGFNKMLKTIAPMMPDAKEIKAVGHGWSGAMALITDKLVYKTDLDPEGAKKIASKQEVKAYERLQGRYAPLLYAANEKESMIVEKIEGRDLKKIMEDYAAPIRASKEEQAKLKKETKPRIAKLENELENEKNPERRKEIKKAIEDLENANKLLDRQIRKDIKQFNEIFSQFYRYVGSLGRAMQDMGVVHNDLASANVFFKDYKIDPVTNKVDPGKISAIDLGMSTTMPSAKQKAEDEATTIQRALIDISLWGILDANKIRNSIKKGYKKALPIPEARQIDPSLLIPLNPAKEIPIGYSGKSLLQETVGDLPQFKPTAILPTYTVEKSYTPTPVSTIPKGYQVIKVNPVTQSTSVSATPNGYQVTRVNPVTQSTSGKDIEVSEKAKLAVKSAQELAAKFNANFAKLRSLLKDAETTGNFAPVIELSAAIKQYGDKAKADITKLRNSAGIDPNFAKSRESSQLSNSLSQITSVQNKAARISALHGGVRIGENIGAGVSEGVKNSIGDLRTAAEKLADIVPDVVTEKLKMQSPSKVMEGYGENVGAGMTEGLESSLKDLRTSSEKLANTVIDTVEEKLEIKSPSRWAIRTGQNIGNAMGTGADESLNRFKTIIASKISEMRKGIEGISPTKFNYATLPKPFPSTSSFPILPTSYEPSTRTISSAVIRAAIENERKRRRAAGMINGIPDPWNTPAGHGLPNIVSTNQKRVFPITPDPWSSPQSHQNPPLSYTIPGTTRSGTSPGLPNTSSIPPAYLPPQVPQSISFPISNTTPRGIAPQLPPFLPNGIPQVPQSTIENGVKKNSQSFVRLGIMLGKYVGEGFTKGLQFLEGGNNGIIPSLIRQINRIKESVENGTITSDVEKDKERLSRGFSKGLGSIPGFKEAKERFKGYLDFLKEIANPNVSAALGEGLANGIVAAKELFVDFLKMPEKIKEGFIQAKVAFDSFVEGMSKVQKFGEMMDFVKSSIGNVVKVLALLAVGKIILDLAPASIEVAANFENLERRIKFTSGSISEGAKNIAFLRSEAKRLNVDLSQTLESGSKFFQATKDTPIEGYQSRQIVSAVTQASAVYGLDLDKQQRTFTALEQMSGKTVVSQEELRQQLAEAIPNASQIAANAYGTTTQSMNQLLSTGRVLAEDFLPKFAQQLKAQTSSGVGDAVNSSVAITNKFNNSLIELQESIGKTLLPFRNFSLSVFASGIDLVTKNFQLLKSVLLITLIKLGSPVWLMFATYLKGISSSAGGAKGALLGMGQSIATLAAQMFVLSMAMKAIDEIMMKFKDNSGAIGEQTRNVTQSINEQRKLLNPSSKVSRDDFSAFRERFTLNPFDNDTKKLIKQMEDSAKQTTIGQQNTFDILKDSNSPAIQDAIQEIQAIDKSLDDIKMKRRAVIANNPGDIQQLRELQEQEKELSQRREKPLELFGGTKANLDKQVETLKTYLEYWEELKKNPKLYQSEIEQINKIIKVTEQDLATVIQKQDKMTKAIKNSLTEMQKFAIEIRNLEAKFNDLRQYRDTALSLEKTNLFNLGSSGDVLPGQLEYTNNLKTQATLTGKIADNLKQIQEMSAQLEVNDLDGVLNALNLNKRSGIDTLKAAQERSIDGSKEKEILSGFIKVKEMQIQTVDMQQQIAEQKYNLIQSLYQQTKQVTDYYRAAVRESQAVGIEFEKAQKTFENSKVQNKLREALIGAGDNIYTQFIEGIINVISQTTEIEKQRLEARKQRIDYQNNVQDIQLQAIELQRSLPGKIISIDSSIADNFNLSLENVNRTVDEINKNINNLSNSVVDATKKAEDSIKDLSKTSNSWIEGLGTKFADLVKSFENGFDRVGTAITDMGIKTSNWLASLATGQGLLQNLAGGVQSAVSTVFGEKAGQQLEQGAKEFVSNPIGALKQFYGVDNNSTPSTRLKAKGKVGFVENSSSSIDSARGHIGDDIFAPIGSKIFSPLAGTVVQSRVGGTKNTDDANPLVPGYQPQQLVIIKLDMPIEFEGKKITHLNMRHLLDRNVQVGQKVKTGDLLGTVGEAGGRGTQFGTRNPGTARDADAAHLHIEYAPSENNQRNSLPDSQASRLTAKLSKEYSGGVQNTVNTPKTSRNRQPVPKVPLVPGLDPRIDTKFLQSVAKIAQSVGANPEDLLKTMLYETGGTLSPSARNKRTNATGLIQFMPATARGLGTNIDALSQMSPQEQLVFVQKYLKQNSRGQKLDSFRKVLSTVFAGNPNASLGVGDGDITLGNYLPKAENRYGNTARQLVQIVMQGGSIQPNQMQEAVTQASRLKLNTAAQQYQTNQTNSNLNPEQIRENELKQRLEAYRLIMSSQKTAIGDISSTKDSTLGTRITVLKGLSPNMSNADMFSLQFNELRRKLEKDVELLKQIIRETDGAIAQKPDLQAAFNLAMKRFPNDPRLAAAAIQTNDLSFKATAFKNAEAKNSLKFLESNIDSILKASMKDFDKKEFFRLSEQDISQQSKVIEQLQQQLQLVQKLEEIDPLNPLVLKIPSLQRNISLLELTRDQYQQLLDLQRRYYDGGGKGGNMSEAAFQKEFKAILNVNSVKREGVDLNFNYADTVKRIKQANDELTKSQTIQASQMKSLQLDNERFAIDNKDGMVSLVSLTNELTIKTNELTNAYKKQLLEIQGNTLLSPQEKLIERLKAFRNYGKEKSNLDAENSYQTKLAPITNRGIELGRMEKLNSSGSAISSEIIRGRGLFGVRDKELQKAQLLSQIKMDFEKEKNEIAKLGLSSNYSAEEISVLSENLLKLNELKLDNVAKEFNMFTEAISGIKGDFDNILKGFFMNDSVNKNAGDLQDINKSLDEIAKKRRDIIMNTSGNIQEVRNAYQNSGNNKQLKELDRAQRDLEKKKTELSKRSIVDAFSEIAKSILSNLAAVASKELSNQLFGKLTEIIFGNKVKDVGAIALNNAGANLSVSATMLQQAALALQNIMGAGSKDGGVLDSIFGAFGESSFGILEGSSAIPFSSSGAFDFSDGFSLGGLDGGLDFVDFGSSGAFDFGSATLSSFAKGGMVGDLLNKERAISGFNPRLIIANEGERVLTPKETKLWNQLNSSNKLESFSSGGMIGEGLGNINNVGRSGDTINITPNVNINNSEGGNGNINKALFEKALEAKIQETIKQERRPGGSLNRGGLYDR
jgi:tape measure domain-containing protein